MAVDFSGPIPDLALTVDRGAAVPLGQQVQEALRTAIRSGRLRAGERLPSTRQLAEQLGVSRGLVVTTYEQLLAEGYLDATTGSGTRVAPGLSTGQDSRREPSRTPGTVARPPTPPQSGDSRTRIDFGYGLPDLGAFPRRDWLWALGEAIKALPTSDLGDGDPAGDDHLREVLAGYHRRVRAGCAEASETVVVGGFRQGLVLVLSALAARGVRLIGLEDPGPREHDEIARRAGLAVAALPVDVDGVSVDALEVSGARAVLLTPAHQCPTGAVLSARRRRRLVDWAHDVDGVIIEDDYDAEFRYDRQPVGSLQGLAPDRVVALGSVSKTLAPALRIGWVLVPPQLREALLAEKNLATRGVPQLDQAALARLIESGRFDRHLRRVREIYRQRREELVDAVNEFLPGSVMAGLDAGHHVLLTLPEGTSERRIVDEAAARGVAVRGLGDYRVTPDVPPRLPPRPEALVIGFGNVTTRQIREGTELLGSLVTRARVMEPGPTN